MLLIPTFLTGTAAMACFMVPQIKGATALRRAGSRIVGVLLAVAAAWGTWTMTESYDALADKWLQLIVVRDDGSATIPDYAVSNGSTLWVEACWRALHRAGWVPTGEVTDGRCLVLTRGDSTGDATLKERKRLQALAGN